jgi:hypothetical protein
MSGFIDAIVVGRATIVVSAINAQTPSRGADWCAGEMDASLGREDDHEPLRTAFEKIKRQANTMVTADCCLRA